MAESRTLERCEKCSHARWSGDTCKVCAAGAPKPVQSKSLLKRQPVYTYSPIARETHQYAPRQTKVELPMRWRETLKANATGHRGESLIKATVSMRGYVGTAVGMSPEQLRTLARYYVMYGENEARDYMRVVRKGKYAHKTEEAIQIMRDYEHQQDKKRGY